MNSVISVEQMKGLGSTVILKGTGHANRARQNVPIWLARHQPQV